jgi:hypothetical protein
MAKKKGKTGPKDDPQGELMFDTMPGADKPRAEDGKGFEVDLNFDTPTEDEEVFPNEEGAQIEEAEEEVSARDETDNEEVQEEDTAEIETQAEEQTDDSSEDVVEEALATEDERTARSDDGGDEEEVLEEPVKSKAPMVPKSRLDEVLAKNKAMQKRINAIEEAEASQQKDAPQYEFTEKEQQYQQLVLDGEATQASALRNEIRQAEREQVMFDVQQQMGQTVQQDRAAQELQKKAIEIESTFPILDQNSTNFDEALTQEVMELRDAFMVQGYEAADSLAKATEYTLAAKRPDLLQGSDDSPLQDNVTQLKQKKQKSTVKKKIGAAKAQPPSMKGQGAGERGDKPVDVDVLSDDEFGALPEDTLRRMRGDFG